MDSDYPDTGGFCSPFSNRSQSVKIFLYEKQYSIVSVKIRANQAYKMYKTLDSATQRAMPSNWAKSGKQTSVNVF